MKSMTPHRTHLIAIPLGVLVLAGLSGLAFAGWVDKGPGIFMALASSGLGWCF